jgi:hypothetical protein
MRIILLIILFFLLSGSSPQKYNVPAKESVLRESYKILVAQVGVKEEGENRGKKIYEYQKTVGIPPGAPYCAAGQYYCFKMAVQNLNLDENAIPIKKTGLANEIFNDAKKKGKKVEYKPFIHDLIVWRRGRTIFGHIERIVEVFGYGWVKTVAFNTNNGNEAGVFYKKRNIYHPLQQMAIVGLVGFNRYE